MSDWPELFCSTYGCESPAQLKCGLCDNRYYCSNGCMVEDWCTFGHKSECPGKKKRKHKKSFERRDQESQQWRIYERDFGQPISNDMTDSIGASQVEINSENSFQCPLCIKSPPSVDKLHKRKILALDGGGIKALVTLHVLKVIFEGKEEQFPVWKVFDMVAGTSTGAILGSLLCAKRFTIQQCIDFYMKAPAFAKSSSSSSGKSKSFSSIFIGGAAKKLSGVLNQVFTFSAYDSRALKKILQDEFKPDGRLDGEYAKSASDPDNKSAPGYIPYLVIVALRVDITPTPVLYTNYKSGHTCSEKRFAGKVIDEGFLWEGPLASGAAPTYFSPYSRTPDVAKVFGGSANEFNQAVLIDGGVGNNSPAILAMEQASCIWPVGEVGFILSLGTGLSPSSDNSGYTPFRNDPYRLDTGSNLNPLRRLLASTSAFKSLLSNVILGYTLYGIPTSVDSGSLLESFGINYLRIDPQLKTPAPIAADPSDKQGKIVIARMIQETMQYLSTPSGILQIREARQYLFGDS